MLNLFQKRSTVKSWKSKEVFLEYFFSLEVHRWITENRYIKSNIEEFFTYISLRDINKIFETGELLFINSSGTYGCAVSAMEVNTIVVFPELKRAFQSMNPSEGFAIMAHELGHIIYEHSRKSIDPLEAQVQADQYAIDKGFGEELEDFLLGVPESIEKRVRLSYLTSKLIDN